MTLSKLPPNSDPPASCFLVVPIIFIHNSSSISSQNKERVNKTSTSETLKREAFINAYTWVKFGQNSRIHFSGSINTNVQDDILKYIIYTTKRKKKRILESYEYTSWHNWRASKFLSETLKY